MNTKSVTVLISIFAIQFVTSCVYRCTCDDSVTYEVIYESITVTPWNTSGFNASEEVTDSVYRNAFGITLSVNFEPKEVSCSQTGFGFSKAMAWSCSCPDDEYTFVDPIAYAEVFVTNVDTNEQIEVSSLFGTYGYDNELISLDELFDIRQEWHDGFQFELINFDSIPSSAIFTVNVYLQSGMKFTEQTQQINFYD